MDDKNISWEDSLRSQGNIVDNGNPIDNLKKEGKFVGKENVEDWENLEKSFRLNFNL